MNQHFSLRILSLLLAVLLTASGCHRTAPADTGDADIDRPVDADAPPFTPPETVPSVAAEVPFTPVGEEEDGMLRVYMDNLAVRMYLAENPGADVEIVCTEEMIAADGFDEDVDLAERLRHAEGEDLPDVMILRTADPWNGRDGVGNLTELAREGLLYDLDRLLGEDILDFCVPEVMEAGIFDEQRVLFPLLYSIGMLYTTEERLDAAGIPWEEGMDLETFSAAFPAFWKTHANANTFRNFWYPDVMCAQNGVDLRTDSPESRAAAEKLCRAFNNFFPNVLDKGTTAYYVTSQPWYPGSLEESWAAGDFVFLSGFSAGGSQEFLSFFADRYYAEDVKKGEHPLSFPMPTIDGGAPYPVPTWSVAVSSRTEHPQAAARFIWYLLSMTVQNGLTSGGIPVNRTSQDYWRSVFLDYKVKNNAPVDMDEDFVNRYFDTLTDLRSPVWWDANGNSLLTWCAIGMATGQSFEEAYLPVREKLDAYFAGN